MSLQLEQVVDYVKHVSKGVAEEKQAAPIMFLLKDSLITMVVIAETPDGFSMGETVQAILRQFQPDAYIALAEARMKSVHPEDIGLVKLHGIADDPDNPEVLAMSYSKRGGPPVFLKADIATVAAGIRIVGEWKPLGGATGTMLPTEW